MKNIWNGVYKKEFRANWYPMDGIVRFTARYLKRRKGIDVYDSKKKIKRVLDLGCGNGNHLKFFAEQGYDVHGIDISKEAIEIAKSWLTGEGLKANLKTSDAEKLPFDNNHFDLIICHGMLDHVRFEKAKKIMDEIKRVLLPRGYVFLTLRSVEDCEYGLGDKVEKNTFILKEGYEKGAIQHFFGLNEIKILFEKFKIFDIELHEQKFPNVYTHYKAFLQSSGKTNKYIDLSKPIKMDLKYSRWFIAAENR